VQKRRKLRHDMATSLTTPSYIGAHALGDWVAEKGRNLTDIFFITYDTMNKQLESPALFERSTQ
jgi:hypothetical protein